MLTLHLLMAIIWAFAAKFGYSMLESLPFVGQPLVYMGIAGVFINVILMILNLLPLPPPIVREMPLLTRSKQENKEGRAR